MCASRADKPAYTMTCRKCKVERCSHMRCGCGPAPVTLKSWKDATQYPVVLTCSCTRQLGAIMVRGEVSNRGTRSCDCGITVAFELELVSHVDRPIYRISSGGLVLTPEPAGSINSP